MTNTSYPLTSANPLDEDISAEKTDPEADRASQPRRPGGRVLALVRLALGWLFLWAFLDKLVGLGYDTASGSAWLDGVSPTAGFLGSRSGLLGEQFQSMVGSAWADFAFMGALCGLGLALILGIGLRIAAIGGTLLMLLMWAAMLPLANNPFMDQHIIYALALIALAATNAGHTWGLGRPWENSRLVTTLPVLK
ncbi:DoxX family membrane protein [Natronoglycomyces albus]|uniref:DoxX family membrane protein n=1 Tax=Natronoglycomyces albus TaxID=2811108 RepID=A0A895XRE9_9ACTN|nr:DoxX family membrane protein [Natronoglycomyces albus]QSB06103.1 DoxX family membrane protein [Natronoglycomyces albus]